MFVVSPRVSSSDNDTLPLHIYRLQLASTVLPYEELSEIRNTYEALEFLFLIYDFYHKMINFDMYFYELAKGHVVPWFLSSDC